ncbi:MAG: SDR family NAD(P)-dependent oxidoreductase, partial [Parvularculaceae bacterium]|nr:SDR family NAD(P)-dependent oxidoreductase [Parvularculaceae bacterium]
MPTQHDGRIALVTGAGKSTGLGVAVSAALARSGMRVLLTARRGADASARAAALAADGLSVEGVELDVADPQSARGVADSIERRFGRLDVLVNNAGGVEGYGEKPSTIALDMVRRQLELNLIGAWTTSQAFLPLLQRAAPGRLVHVGSGAGSHADTGFGLATGA